MKVLGFRRLGGGFRVSMRHAGLLRLEGSTVNPNQTTDSRAPGTLPTRSDSAILGFDLHLSLHHHNP